MPRNSANRPLPEAAQPRVNDSTAQRAFDLLFIPLREVVRFLQPWVAPEKWTPLTLQTTWANYGVPNSFQLAAYRKSPAGRVHLRGLVQRSGGAGTTIAVLPVGYRPRLSCIFYQYDSAGGVRVDVNAAGGIVYFGGAGAVDVSLEGIEFDAAGVNE